MNDYYSNVLVLIHMDASFARQPKNDWASLTDIEAGAPTTGLFDRITDLVPTSPRIYAALATFDSYHRYHSHSIVPGGFEVMS